MIETNLLATFHYAQNHKLRKGRSEMKFRLFSTRQKSLRQSLMSILVAFLVPIGAMGADIYQDADFQKIVALARGSAIGLKRVPFEDALLPLIKTEDVGATELASKLANPALAIPPKGINDVLKVAKKAAQKKAAQQQAAIKAKALAEAHAAAVTAHSTAKAAAEDAKTAHDNASREPGNASKAEEAAAKDQAAAAAAEKSSNADTILDNTTPTTNSMWSVLIWSGAKLQNPYSITNGSLKPNNSKTDPFIDLELVHRYVLCSDSYGVDNLFFSWFDTDRKFGDGKWDFYFPGQLFPDLDFRVGYVFTGSSTVPTNLTVSTIAGGSDFYSDNSLGIPIWRWSNPKDKWDQQATIELGGGFVTDKEFLAIHPNYFAGLGYQFHTKDWTWQTRFGLGAADVPRLRGGSNVATNSMGLPLFELKHAPSWGTQITYDVGAGVKLQVGANAYFDERAVWNLSAGLSIEPSTLFSSFAKKK